ncbi:microsomal glutathione S-transferase 1-like [Styela clava]
MDSATIPALYSLKNPAFVSLVKFGTLIVAKMVLMSIVTTIYRVIYNSYVSEEDYALVYPEDKEKVKKKALVAQNANVERVRRAHQNDLENIVPFVLLAMFYIATNPDPATAALVFKSFAAIRFLHTIFYIGKIRQPSRSLAFFGGLLINMFMAQQILFSLCDLET